MINIKNAMYTVLKNEIASICPNSGTVEQETPPSFPYLSFIQKDNPSYKKTQDSGSKENHVQPMIQIDIYTTDSMYKCETIADKADAVMQSCGWERIFGPQPIKSSYFRITMRYQGIVKKNGTNDFTII